jgi:hypothetical protein
MKYDMKDDILKKANNKIKDLNYEGNVVIMVKKKNKKKRGKKRRGKKPRAVEIKEKPKDISVEESPNEKESVPVVKGLNPSKITNNKHRRWDQYYESIFFISHVSYRSGLNKREMKILKLRFFRTCIRDFIIQD